MQLGSLILHGVRPLLDGGQVSLYLLLFLAQTGDELVTVSHLLLQSLHLLGVLLPLLLHPIEVGMVASNMLFAGSVRVLLLPHSSLSVTNLSFHSAHLQKEVLHSLFGRPYLGFLGLVGI